jgi:hypothetical protein
VSTDVRFAGALALTVAALAGCQTGSGERVSGGQGGITLSFGAADSFNCSAPSAGEGGAGFLLGEGGASASCAASAAVDYATQVAPILGRCWGEVCHNFKAPESIGALIGAPADECCDQRELIAPGHPERSYLVDKLQGQRLCYGTRMPQDRAPLADADLAIIQAWICQGAVIP